MCWEVFAVGHICCTLFCQKREQARSQALLPEVPCTGAAGPGGEQRLAQKCQTSQSSSCDSPAILRAGSQGPRVTRPASLHFQSREPSDASARTRQETSLSLSAANVLRAGPARGTSETSKFPNTSLLLLPTHSSALLPRNSMNHANKTKPLWKHLGFNN